MIAAEHGLAVDESAAEAALRARQGEGGRGADLGGEAAVGDAYFRIHAEVGDTEFVGYETTQSSANVVAVVESGEEVEVVLDRTPMYAESGGQIGDRGEILGEGLKVTVTDTVKPVGGLHVHRGKVVEGTLAKGQAVEVWVDVARRDAIPPQPLRDAPAAPRAAHRAGRPRGAERLARRPRTGFGSTSATARRCRPSSGRRSRRM